MSRSVKENVVPVNGFYLFQPAVLYFNAIEKPVPAGLVLMNLCSEGGIGTSVTLSLTQFSAAAPSFRILNSFLISRPHSHLVKVLNRAAKRVLLPADSFFTPIKLDDYDVGGCGRRRCLLGTCCDATEDHYEHQAQLHGHSSVTSKQPMCRRKAVTQKEPADQSSNETGAEEGASAPVSL